MGLKVERRDVDRWVVKLDEATSKANEEATKVVGMGANKIKNDARRTIRRQLSGGKSHLRRYPYSIGYDVYQGLRGPAAEIGPDRTRNRLQADFGHLIEYGSPTSAPMPHMIPAGEREAPRFEKAMTDLAARLLEER